VIREGQPGDQRSQATGTAAWERKALTTCHVTADAAGRSTMKQSAADITLADFQALIREMYLEKDLARGVDGTFMWLMEEVGELASALREGTRAQQAEEFADVLAWLTTIANVVEVDLAEAVAAKYGSGCPGCGRLACSCPDEGKP